MTMPKRRTLWSQLTQSAVWLSGVISTFVFTTPDILNGAHTVAQPWPNLVRFLLAFLSGVLFVLSRRWGKTSRWSAWIVSAVALLILGCVALTVYWNTSLASTCQYRGVHVMIGSGYVDARIEEAARAFGANCAGLIDSVQGETPAIWPVTNLARRQTVLAGLLALTTCLFAASMMCLLEGVARSGVGATRGGRKKTGAKRRAEVRGLAAVAVVGALCSTAAGQDVATAVSDEIVRSEWKAALARFGQQAPLEIGDAGATEWEPGKGARFARAQFAELLKRISGADPLVLLRFLLAHELAHEIQFATLGDRLIRSDADDRRVWECQADVLAAEYVWSTLGFRPEKPENALREITARAQAAERLAGALGNRRFSHLVHPSHDQRRLAMRYGVSIGVLALVRTMTLNPDESHIPAALGQSLDVRSGEELLPWAERMCRRITQYRRDAVASLSVGSRTIVWPKKEDPPLVTFAIPYRNTSDRYVKVGLTIQTISVPKGARADLDARVVVDMLNEEFELPPLGEHVVRGTLTAVTSAEGHVVRLLFDPGEPGVPIEAQFISQAVGGQGVAAGHWDALPPETQELGRVLLLYALNAATGFDRLRGSAGETISGTTYYPASIAIPDSLETEIVRESNLAASVSAKLFDDASAEQARAVYELFKARLQALWPDKGKERTLKSGAVTFDIPYAVGAKLSLGLRKSSTREKYIVDLDIEPDR